ncbi:starch phosphorylase [Motilibacter rhizosphaerae]|uniref:glycogen phosphorylase n=1 Tax=Motilibacter rhizosphaerae TaxID=598652 RepID=A0A4V2F4B9_9ACTN|nr:alpha-glucan family phosphorylase [Motilibacter rhizosphaerae]RZS87067.1 starch phosphorylase [Motilibacter rhizosphaerae]
MRAIRRFTVRTVLPEALSPLGELALNLRWCWHPDTQDLFRAIDPDQWEAVGHDPLALLGALPPARLEELAEDRRFVRRVADAAEELRDYVTGARWYQSLREGDPGSPGAVPRSIAYFSPEFGITGVLPQYSGGLGILAGDHLKSASDLGVPIVGVGLLYRAGYFRQSLSREGWQQEHYPVLDPNDLPISLLREADGTPVEVSLPLPDGRALHARVWRAQVGRVPLLMLDSDVEANEPAEREVTGRLYGGGTETRLLQELLLGVGGVRALRAYSRVTGAPEPEVFHTNEGHAGFLGLERIREYVAAGLSWDEALEATRAGTVFTTHTPVPAGIDRFPRHLVEQHFSGELAPPGVGVEKVLSLGAESYEGGDPGVFNMAVMGLRLGQRANGVSLLHGDVSRGMFQGLWPGFDQDEVPITSITNGVHAPTWVAREALQAAEREGGARDWEGLSRLSDSALWNVRRVLRGKLVEDARARVRASWLERGASEAELGWVDSILDPDVLTIGFARRVPSYKRLTLMLRDPARLKALLLHPERPIQIVVAGKAHPADEGGKRFIQDLVRFTDDPEVRHRIVFLPNYDIAMAQTLLPGSDVWLNNPLRPLEASGTSGMKAALNGGLNLSILDGWWDEWYDGENGWSIPTADGVTDPEHRDALEASALYDLLENQVTPRFYDRDGAGVATRWVEMVRHTLQSLGPKVLASRMVRDYVLQLYAPAAASTRALGSDLSGAKALAAWKGEVRGGWHGVRVDHVETEGIGDAPEVGSVLQVKAFVSLGALTPADVEVQLVHGRVDADDQLTDVAVAPLVLAESYEGGRARYEGTLPLARTGAFGYTVRVLPAVARLASPAELGLVANAVASEPAAVGAPPLR